MTEIFDDVEMPAEVRARVLRGDFPVGMSDGARLTAAIIGVIGSRMRQDNLQALWMELFAAYEGDVAAATDAVLAGDVSFAKEN